ncbi:MAG: hypothetical protein HPY61_12325 [Methanotrichaceae archaeon]|nr:hypothetical protein [Methanotrichaceae archaeon]
MAKNRKKGKIREIPEPIEEKSQDAVLSKSKSAPPKPRPKSAAEDRRDRMDGIIKTVYPSVLGVIAAFACFYSPDMILQLPWHSVVLLVVAVTFVIQKLTYPFLNIDVASFQTKDWFYVEFIAVDLWLVGWTLLLN